jgi:hypothetical protein
MLQQISTSEKRVKIDVIEKTLQHLYVNIYKQLYNEYDKSERIRKAPKKIDD